MVIDVDHDAEVVEPKQSGEGLPEGIEIEWKLNRLRLSSPPHGRQMPLNKQLWLRSSSIRKLNSLPNTKAANPALDRLQHG